MSMMVAIGICVLLLVVLLICGVPLPFCFGAALLFIVRFN